MTTIDSVTDEQIEALREEAAQAGDHDQVAICTLAIDGTVWPGDHHEISARCAGRLVEMAQADARAACAKAIASAEAQS